MSIDAAATITAASGTVTLKPRTAGTQINLGAADASGSPAILGLTDAELDRITAGTLVLGSSSNAAITVSSDLTRLASTNIQLVSSGDIVISGGQVSTAGGTLLLDSGTSPAAIKPSAPARM